MEIYIVVKTTPIETKAGLVDFRLNEAVFSTEKSANEYVKKRKALKDRDDRGSTFAIEPWFLG